MPGDQLYPRLSGEGITLCRGKVKRNVGGGYAEVEQEYYNNLIPRLRLLNSEIG